MKKYYIFISKKEKKYDLDIFLLNNGKNIEKLNKCYYWALDPLWILDDTILTTEHSNDIPNSLVLFGFTCWLLKISWYFKKNVIKEANWIVGSITYTTVWFQVFIILNFPPQLPANHNRLISKLTNCVTGWK